VLDGYSFATFFFGSAGSGKFSSVFGDDRSEQGLALLFVETLFSFL